MGDAGNGHATTMARNTIITVIIDDDDNHDTTTMTDDNTLLLFLSSMSYRCVNDLAIVVGLMVELLS